MSGLISTGFYPFWFWNDNITEDEVKRQVAAMADQGIKGFFIHTRQGCQRPYLSESFFQMVDAAVEAAEEHGMTVCLYDEYPYPSGIAGGEVTLGNPRFHATRLAHQSQMVEGGHVRMALPAGKVLSVKAFPVDGDRIDYAGGIDLRDHVGVVLIEDSYVETGLTAYNRKRYFASEPAPVLEVTLPPGRFKISATCQVEVRHHKYWDHFVDILDPEAVQTFIKLTHERYRARYGEKLGTSIAAIFVDEVEPGWSDRIPEAFAEKYGYDICEHLLALHDRNHPDHARVSHDLYRLIYELFCQTFEEPISRWCRRHGVSYCGEKPSMRLSQLRYMDIPGCDSGHRRAGDGLDVLQGRIRGNARAVASAAYFYDKQASLCECYHSLGWGATLQDAKMIAEALLVSGVNCLVPHGFFYSTHALKKHDAPPSFFFQMPYYKLFSKLSERLDRIDSLISGTHIDAQVLVVDPHSGIPDRSDVGVYADILQSLAQNHIDFHIVDTDILEMGQIGDGVVKVKEVCARVAVVPPMNVVEDPLREWLEAFRKSGGRVIECSQDADLNRMLEQIREVVQPSLSVQCDGKELADVYLARRVSKRRSLWLVLNSGDQAVDAEIRVGPAVAAEGMQLREIPLDPGVPCGLRGGAEGYKRLIYPFEFFVIEATECGASSEQDPSAGPDASVTPEMRDPSAESGRSADCGLPFDGAPPTDCGQAPDCDTLDCDTPDCDMPDCDMPDCALPSGYGTPLECPILDVSVSGPASIRLENKNLLRMYEWEMSLLEEDGPTVQTAVVPAVPISDQLEKGGFRFAPINRKFFGAVPKLEWPRMSVRYEFRFDSEYDGAVELVMEPGSIVGEWKVFVNNSAPIGPERFGPATAHVRGSLGVDITALLRRGRNSIRVDLVAEKANHGLLNCLYLAGDFGVQLQPLCLVPRKEAGLFERYVENLIPFYSGVVDYTTEFELEGVPKASSAILRFRYDDLDGGFREATEVSVNGSDFQPVLWEPRCIKVSTDLLRVGKNSLTTRVYTTLIRSFEGIGSNS